MSKTSIHEHFLIPEGTVGDVKAPCNYCSAVERLFSIAGKVFRPDRCRLKDEMFERLMMIRCNTESPKS